MYSADCRKFNISSLLLLPCAPVPPASKLNSADRCHSEVVQINNREQKVNGNKPLQIQPRIWLFTRVGGSYNKGGRLGTLESCQYCIEFLPVMSFGTRIRLLRFS